MNFLTSSSLLPALLHIVALVFPMHCSNSWDRKSFAVIARAMEAVRKFNAGAKFTVNVFLPSFSVTLKISTADRRQALLDEITHAHTPRCSDSWLNVTASRMALLQLTIDIVVCICLIFS